MSDEEFDEECFRAYENELYGEKSSESNEEIDSEIEDALYSQVHYSFSVPNEEDLPVEEKDIHVSSTPSVDNQQIHSEQDDKEPDDQEDVQENKVQIIVISDSEDNDSCDSNDDDNNDNDDKDDTNSTVPTESTQENWSLIEEDLESNLLADGKRRQVSRYYKSQPKVRCRNCNERGHKAKDCPTPKKICCFLCGGEHIRKHCPNELCFNCHEPGHRVMNCRKPRSRPDDQCRRCFMLGHHFKNCPDRWRQYHRTTDATKLPVADRSGEFTGPVYCYNCSEKGHYGHECTEDRMEYHVIPTFPVVVKYDGLPDKHQDNHSNRRQEQNRMGTKTNDGTVTHFRRGISETTKRQRKKEQRKSWPNHGHVDDDDDRSTTNDGTVDQFYERISERTKKRRGKEQRKSWPNHGHVDDDDDRSTTNDGTVDQFYERISERTKKRQRGKEQRKSWPNQSNDAGDQSSGIQGSAYGNFENHDKLKMGSKRKHGGTPHHGESKRSKQEHKKDKRRNKKKEKASPSGFRSERVVELIYDDNVYGNNQRDHKEKRKNKFNRRVDELPDTFTRMIEDWEEMNTRHHHSSPGSTSRRPNTSSRYGHYSPQGSSHHWRTDNKRLSRENDSKSHKTVRGFRSKWN